MPNAEFLETYPLYRKFKYSVPATLDRIPKVQINMDCGKCSAVRTFLMVTEYYRGYPHINFNSGGEIILVKYMCVSCREYERTFALKISDNLESLTKVGQEPPWTVKVNADVSAMLGAHQSYLQRGMISESQGYGIGAFAYYRRIVEETIDSLLLDVEQLIPEAERSAFSAALAKTKETRVTSEKIELVQDLLPAILRPDNMNPLALLHGVLSEGLHADTDERCLELAAEVREILTFLASQVAIASQSSRTFTEKMRTLLQKRTT
jgi:hypothetical protein